MKNKKGILLFEVVVAVTVLAVGLTIVSRSFTSCIRALEIARDYNTAIILAEQALWDLENKEVDSWERDGEFEGKANFSWQQDNEDVEGLKLKDVELGVKWKRRNRDYKLTIATSMLNEEE